MRFNSRARVSGVLHVSARKVVQEPLQNFLRGWEKIRSADKKVFWFFSKRFQAIVNFGEK